MESTKWYGKLILTLTNLMSQERYTQSFMLTYYDMHQTTLSYLRKLETHSQGLYWRMEKKSGLLNEFWKKGQQSKEGKGSKRHT